MKKFYTFERNSIKTKLQINLAAAVAVKDRVVVGLLLLVVLHEVAGPRLVVVGSEVEEQRPGDCRAVLQ